MDIIEINSSPELRPQTRSRSRQTNRAGKGKKRARPLPTGDIIELSDSDGEGNKERMKRARPTLNPARADGPVAGPSRVANQPLLPLFLPDIDDIDMRIPGPHMARRPPAPNGLNDVARAGVPVPPMQAPLPAQPAPVAFPPAAAPLQAEASVIIVEPPEESFASRMDSYVAQVLEIVPDVLPEHVRTLVERLEPTYNAEVVARIIHLIFEDPTYPKVDPKGKGKRKREDEDDERGAKSVKVDYASKDREPPGPIYILQAEVRTILHSWLFGRVGELAYAESVATSERVTWLVRMVLLILLHAGTLVLGLSYHSSATHTCGPQAP